MEPTIKVLYKPLQPPENDSTYSGCDTETTVLKAGHRREQGRAAFTIDTTFERNIIIPMRDGIKLRADIFRPADQGMGKVPALIAYSPYGKSGSGFLKIDMMPGRAGIPLARLSGYESFEAPDPAEWAAKGYAVCNVDARGAFDSEGGLRYWGSGEGQDGYDVIEHIAALPWCSGDIALVGNSWLAINQWFIAAEKPEHLKCIVPLEGQTDAYRESLCRGGIPAVPFAQMIGSTLFGRNQQEDIAAMVQQYPLWNEYWEDKRAKLAQIEIPAYVLASYSSGLHTEGSFRAFEELAGPKWLRVHATQEWHDLYQECTSAELQQFLDHYLKGVENGWEQTPQVRVSVLRFNQAPIVNVPLESYPPPDTEYRKLFLTASGQLSELPPSDVGSLSYQSDVPAQQQDNDGEELSFKFTFKETTTLLGWPRAKLYVSCLDHDDMDVYVILRKADREGKILQNINIPLDQLGMPESAVPNITPMKYLGPSGMLRASHREIDEKPSRPHKPVFAHRSPQKVPPGTVVELNIPLWPCGIHFEAGESVVLNVSGHEMRVAELPGLHGTFRSGNVGRHRLLCGAKETCSELTIPVVSVGHV